LRFAEFRAAGAEALVERVVAKDRQRPEAAIEACRRDGAIGHDPLRRRLSRASLTLALVADPWAH
jgi:hypothetical protein